MAQFAAASFETICPVAKVVQMRAKVNRTLASSPSRSASRPGIPSTIARRRSDAGTGSKTSAGNGPKIALQVLVYPVTDADFVVKLVDVYPDNAPNNSPLGGQVRMGGFQMLVRGEVMRGKFRNSFSKPEAFTPGKTAEVKFDLQDVNHTFKAGHRIMIQVQSSWFPLVDRNPQKFVDIYNAADSDFQKATHRIFHSGKLSSHLKVGVLK